MDFSNREDKSTSKCKNNSDCSHNKGQKYFLTSFSNSSKRSLFKEGIDINKDYTSDSESDLGIMSPLALTDQSSCDSSPGRPFVSPLATPEKFQINKVSQWNSLCAASSNDDYKKQMSHFQSLKRITRSARLSPNSNSLVSYHQSDNIPTKSNLNKTYFCTSTFFKPLNKESDIEDQLSFVEETPQKEDKEKKFITPLTSTYQNISIPKIYRKKFSMIEVDESLSPEIKKCSFKRHLENDFIFFNAKYQKIDVLSNCPKAKASLLNETDTFKNKKNFFFNPKSFYGTTQNSRKSFKSEWKQVQVEVKKKRSLPSSSSCYYKKFSGKKYRQGQINCGVGHGIKKPKSKIKLIQKNLVKLEKMPVVKNESKENLNPDFENTIKKQNKIFMEKNKLKNVSFLKQIKNSTHIDEIQSTISSNAQFIDSVHEKSKFESISSDIIDSSVEEPNEKSLEKSKINKILKILENDWDAIETNKILPETNISSPKRSTMLTDLTMSPASVLSSMASTMNIKDGILENETKFQELFSTKEESIQKLYPIFNKNNSSNLSSSSLNKSKRNSTWQLSTKHNNTDNQFQIDAGQKLFGATQCDECKIIYHVGDPEDENAHLKYHNSFRNLKFQGWKNERILYKDTYTSDRIILVEPKDSNLYWKKVNEILEIVDQDLGLSDIKLSLYRDKRVYMYVKDKIILGILVAEYVKSAFKMIPDLIDLNCCTTEATPVKCGINVVWTAKSHRKQGIATKLVDTLRTNYYYGYIMSKDDIAFSTPTISGKKFAEKYTQSKNFKVY